MGTFDVWTACAMVVEAYVVDAGCAWGVCGVEAGAGVGGV